MNEKISVVKAPKLVVKLSFNFAARPMTKGVGGERVAREWVGVWRVA